MAKYFFILLLSVAAQAEPGRPLDWNDRMQLGPIEAMHLIHKEGAPTIVYIHGYGDLYFTQYERLAPLIARTPILQEYNWIFPEDPGFSVTQEDFPLWQAELKFTRKKYAQMLKAAGVDPSQVIWAGFSMGGFAAIDNVVHSKVAPLGLITSGAFYYDSKDWNRKSGILKGVPFFQSHDPKMDMFDWDVAKSIETLLTKAGMVGKITKTKVGHNVPPGFITKAVQGITDLNCPIGKLSR